MKVFILLVMVSQLFVFSQEQPASKVADVSEDVLKKNLGKSLIVDGVLKLYKGGPRICSPDNSTPGIRVAMQETSDIKQFIGKCVRITGIVEYIPPKLPLDGYESTVLEGYYLIRTNVPAQRVDPPPK